MALAGNADLCDLIEAHLNNMDCNDVGVEEKFRLHVRRCVSNNFKELKRDLKVYAKEFDMKVHTVTSDSGVVHQFKYAPSFDPIFILAEPEVLDKDMENSFAHEYLSSLMKLFGVDSGDDYMDCDDEAFLVKLIKQKFTVLHEPVIQENESSLPAELLMFHNSQYN